MPMKSNREYRNMVLEIVSEENRDENNEERKLVAGYASTFNEPYMLYEDEDVVFSETVDANAFNEADMSDVIMQYNHEGRVFARISNNTLSVRPDEKGLFIEADLGGTELGRELYDEIRGGYTDKMSFGFTVSRDRYDEETGTDGRQYIVRTIEGIRKVYDVSAVSIPANDGTSISIRNLADGVIERVKAERLEAERIALKQRRLEVRAKAIKSGGNK